MNKILSCVFIVVLGMIIYANSLHTPFQFDDKAFIINNPSIRSLTDPLAIWELLSQPSRFISFYSFAINYHFHQLSVFGYHLTNLIIHILTSIFVFLFVRSLLSLEEFLPFSSGSYFQRNDKINILSLQKRQSLENRNWISLCAGLIFVSHPIQTQAVTYISQRFASLATLFYVSSLFFYLKARIHSNLKISIGCFFLSAFLGILGMFTKEIVITLPLMIGLTEFYFLKTKVKAFFKSQISIFALIILISAFFIIPAIFSFSLKGVLLASRISESHDGDVFTLWPYLMTQTRVAVKFLQLLIFPVGQNLDYDFPISFNPWDFSVIFSSSVLLGLLGLVVYLYRHNRLLSYGIFWFFVAFLANLVPRRHVIFEHKIYLLSIGFCIFLSVGLAKILKTKKQYIITVSCIVFIFAISTIQRNKIWKTEITLWSDVVKKSPNKQRPNINLGSAYLAQKEYDLAIKYLNIALEKNKPHAKGHLNRGVALVANKKYLDALKDYSKAIKIEPDFVQAFVNRGIVFSLLGNMELALNDFNHAVLLRPKFAESYFNRGNLYKSQGDLESAFKDFDKAISLNIRYGDAYRDRGVIYLKRNQYDLSMKDLLLALEFNASKQDRIYTNMAVIQIQKKYYARALDNINKALLINPNSNVAQNNKRIVLELSTKRLTDKSP